MMKVKISSGLLVAIATLSWAILCPTFAQADTVPLTRNAVIVDNEPFENIGLEDVIGTGNFAINAWSYIDIPYAIFDFGSITSVKSATLTWNFLSLYNSEPADITLYVGSDADGIIGTSDRFMGAPINTFTYSAAVLRSYDVTANVNAALSGGPYFAARLEAVVVPDDYFFYGGEFEAPSLMIQIEPAPVPEPASLVLLGTGIGVIGLAALRRRK